MLDTHYNGSPDQEIDVADIDEQIKRQTARVQMLNELAIEESAKLLRLYQERTRALTPRRFQPLVSIVRDPAQGKA